ncbi:LacI family transcriptional regulator [Vreelandella populi]|uniref:LacI family transcriptional regulator n=1 Tax=Vreelandella populi TaxID=2498858 RepID=A0A3S0YK93_9GAMM|nr:LacI family transcriptional regulator [Halomonas populi]RUR46723.1 LacI family transcriptional regulator [Halomonas populi]RUR52767.1 LacI family transcriptional regulator [Halomonas populi]
MPVRITADDVAKAAGVSRAMVSRAFTPGASVSAKKREHVLAVAQTLGYRPNLIARGLTGQRTGLIAVVVGEISRPYEAWLLEHLAQALSAHGYQPLLLPMFKDASLTEILDHALAYQVDGAIVAAGSVSREVADRCRASGAPLVLIGRVLEKSETDAVCCDNSKGMHLLVDRLVRQGRRRIAWLGGTLDTFSDQERQLGVEQALAHHELALTAQLRGDFSLHSGVEEGGRLLDAGLALDGIMCANDAMALGVVEAAAQRGIKVPDEVAITGFDDVPGAAWGRCPLTTVRNPVRETALAALRLLDARLQTPGRATQVVRVGVTLIERASA